MQDILVVIQYVRACMFKMPPSKTARNKSQVYYMWCTLCVHFIHIVDHKSLCKLIIDIYMA